MQTSVKLLDNATNKSIWDTRMVVIPRVGEVIVWEGREYSVEDVEYIGTQLAWVVYLYITLIEDPK